MGIKFGKIVLTTLFAIFLPNVVYAAPSSSGVTGKQYTFSVNTTNQKSATAAMNELSKQGNKIFRSKCPRGGFQVSAQISVSDQDPKNDKGKNQDASGNYTIQCF